jgi:hypothetical protein
METNLEEIEITAKPMRSDAHVDARDFRVHSISLIAADGTAREIVALVNEVQIRQDMYLGFMAGEMLVTDGLDMIAQSKAHGGEYIYLHFEVPEQKITLKKAFRIYKIGKRSPSDSSQKYVIYFMSDELFTSHTKKISKAYKDDTVSNMALDIMKSYLKIPEKRIFIDQTTEKTSYVIPNWRPLEALNWLASRAYTDTMTCFFFYENFNGFNFRSIQSIYKTGTIIKVPFSLENKRGMKKLDMDKFSIDDYEVIRDFDVLSTISSGGYAMRLLGVDTINQKLTKNDYNPSSVTKIYPNNPMTNSADLFKKANSHLLTYLKADGIQNWIKRVMSMAALSSNITEITVPGNMGLNVGTLLSLRIPYTITPADGDMWDKQKSGKYLVFAVNHKFDMVNHQFTSLALLSRDSQPEALPAADKTLPNRIVKMNT